MNRREFLSVTGATALTTGLLSAVPLAALLPGVPFLPNNAFGGATGEQPGTRSVHFRAKRVFLDSWTTGQVHGNSLHAASLVQSQLNTIRRDGCNGLILISGRCFNAEWLKHIKTEANRMGLTVLVPAALTRDFFRKAQTVVPLVQEDGIFQCCDGKALQVAMPPMANEGGFLLINGENDVFGFVQYDVSRCHWTGFASSAAAIKQNTDPCEQNSKLIAARWLDLTRQSFS